MLKVMSLDEVNAKRRAWARDLLREAADAAVAAAGVLELLGASERAGECMSLATKIGTVGNSV